MATRKKKTTKKKAPPLPNKTGGKRGNAAAVAKVEKEKHMEEAVRLYLRGNSYRQIGMKLGVSIGTISAWMTELRTKWMEKTDDLFGLMQKRQLQRYEDLRQLLWEQALKTKTKTKTTIDPTTGSPTELEITEEGFDPKLTAQILQVDREIARLAGLNMDGKKQDEKEGSGAVDDGEGIVVDLKEVISPAGIKSEREVVRVYRALEEEEDG
jgi:transposase